MSADIFIVFNYFNEVCAWLKTLNNQTNQKQFFPIEHDKT